VILREGRKEEYEGIQRLRVWGGREGREYKLVSFVTGGRKRGFRMTRS
jgi:hypothetical protein